MKLKSSGRFVALLAALACLIMLRSAQAQVAPAPSSAPVTIEMIYSVSGIAADQKGDTPAGARDAAMAFARRAAFARLLRRLTLPDDQARLPSLSDNQLSDLIAGIEVADEKTGAKRYMARITVRFDPGEVRALMRRSSVRFSETAAAPVLLLPVFESGGALMLWEAPNPWRDALAAAISEAGAGDDRLWPMLIPAGDDQDQSAINADQALAAAPAPIAAFLARYGASGALIAHGRMLADGIEVNLRQYGPVAGTVEVLRTERFETQAGEAVELAMTRAARVLVDDLQENWKIATALDFDQSAALQVLAPIGSLADWLGLRSLLASEPMIRRIDVRTLSVQEAQLVLQYLGTPEKLQSALLARNLVLSQADGNWVLRKQ